MYRLTARAYIAHTPLTPGADRAHVVISVEEEYAEREDAEGHDWRAPLEDRAIDELRFRARSKGETLTGYMLEWSIVEAQPRGEASEPQQS